MLLLGMIIKDDRTTSEPDAAGELARLCGGLRARSALCGSSASAGAVVPIVRLVAGAVVRGRGGEGHGIPLAVSVTGGNRNDVTQLEPLIDMVPLVRGKRGRPRFRSDALYTDRGYDHDKYWALVRAKGITPTRPSSAGPAASSAGADSETSH